MTFTYNLASTTDSVVLIAKVRLEIGDTVEDTGIRPDGTNLTDEEIAVWLDLEDDDVMLAAARACDAMSRAWSVVANETVGPRKTEYGKVSGDFEKRASSLRETYARPTAYVL